MRNDEYIENIMISMQHRYRSGDKKQLILDLFGQILDNEGIIDILVGDKTSNKYVAITFDRINRDDAFLYSNFDILLSIIDKICGGHGIRKPLHQIRVIKWNGDRSQLYYTLRYFADLNTALSFGSLLILPFPDIIVGNGLNMLTDEY